VQTKQENWDHFWKNNEGSRFTRKSWSKIRIMKLLDQELKPGMAVLDAGCGSGFFSQYFLSRGCEVYTLDYSEEALEMARRKTENKSAAYLKEDLLQPGFGEKFPGKFDLIFTDGLFEHFSEADQKRIMDNFRKTKKPGGVITTFVPNKYSWWEIVRPVVMPGIHEEPFTAPKLARLHEGLRIVKKGGLNALPFGLSPEFLAKWTGMILYCFAR
jgi:2-polyprenyl-3-methyl-5-hydroxy-6-metoxy-1,4-benzoquinol methylase